MNSEKKRNRKKSETLTLDPHSDELRKEKKEDSNRFNPSTKRDPKKKRKKRKEIQIGEGERGNGPTWPCVGMTLRQRGRRRAEPGAAARRARPRGHRGQAARQRRTHPLGSAHAGEGAGDGAMATRSTASLARCVAWLREKGRGERGMGLGFKADAAERVLIP